MSELRNEIENKPLSPVCHMVFCILEKHNKAIKLNDDSLVREYKSRSVVETWGECPRGISRKLVQSCLEELVAAKWVWRRPPAGAVSIRYQVCSEREHRQRVASVLLRNCLQRILEQHSILPEEEIRGELSTPVKLGLKRLCVIATKVQPSESPHVEELLRAYLAADEMPNRTWDDMSDEE